MVLNIQVPESQNLKPTITVVGVGGAGGNAVNNMIDSGVEGVKFVIANTDAQALENASCENRIQLGINVTQGLGAGSYPEVGRAAAEESAEEILDYLQGSNMVFVTAGMGGGTGTGAAPVVAQLAKETGAVVIGVVTMPFESERARIDKAEFGLQELREATDTCIVLDNNRLVDIAGQLPLEQAFAVANELVSTMVKGIVETITLPSLINLDYADVSAIMKNGGVAVIGIGESDAQDRVTDAVKQALTHPLLDVDYKGATGALIHITCGPDLKLEEFDVIGRAVSENLSNDAQVIIGARIAKDFVGKVRVITIMTGVKSPYVLGHELEDMSSSQPVSKEMSDLGIDILG